MARYPREIDEAIWALMCDGLQTADILRALETGDAGVPPTKMPRRTLQDRQARLRRERGAPVYSSAVAANGRSSMGIPTHSDVLAAHARAASASAASIT